MGANIYVEAVVPERKNNFFHQRMIEFVNILELKYLNYQTNVNLRYKDYRVKLLFNMKDFLSFGTYCQSMFYIKTWIDDMFLMTQIPSC